MSDVTLIWSTDNIMTPLKSVSVSGTSDEKKIGYR